ncbi:unnamed protein product, partial [Trichogramma brassicae]
MPSSRLPRNLRPGPWRTSWSALDGLIRGLGQFIQGKSNLHKEVISYQVSLGIALSALRKSLESQVPPRPPVADKAVCTSPLFTGSATSKRLATSPPASHATPKRHAVTPASKQHDENNNEVGDQDGFVLVDRRHHRQRKQTAATPGAVHARPQPKPRPVQRRARHRPDVIVIKAKDASKYADILRSLKSDPTLQQKVGSSPVLCFTRPRSRSRTWTSVPPKEEVTAALDALLGVPVSKRDPVKSLRKAYAGTQVAVVALPDDLAATALKLGHVRIGWVNCRIRAREEAARCYRCWSPGHVAARCKGPDRTELCYRCGQKGHQAKDCKGQPSSPRTADDENPPAQPQSLRGCPGPALRHLSRLRIDVAILCEQYKNLAPPNTWLADADGQAAIWVHGGIPVQERPARVHPYFAWARIGGIFFFSVYAPPRLSEREFSALLANITEEARGRRPLVIAGDFNAWSTEWGCRETRPRAFLLDSLALLDAVLLNTGDVPTFNGRQGSSIVDLTFVCETLTPRVLSWTVSGLYTHSDHQAIVFEIEDDGASSGPSTRRSYRWNARTLDVDRFSAVVSGASVAPGTAEDMASSLMSVITGACDASMSKANPRRRREPGVLAKQPSSPLLVRGAVAALFPRVQSGPALRLPRRAEEPIPAVTLEELKVAQSRIKERSASGPDGIPNSALKIAVAARPDIFLRVYTTCLETGVFPSSWKRQRLVLLPKPGKPPDEPSSYRPLCLLDTAGKILERIICDRLEAFTERPGGLSER